MSLNLNADIIDSRDIEERIDELESEIEDKEEELEDLDEDSKEYTEVDSDLDDLKGELETLTSIRSAVSHSEWPHGLTLISDSHFEDYCRELCEETGYIPKDFPNWIEIDWEATAKNLQMDYSSVAIDGTDYWFTS